MQHPPGEDQYGYEDSGERWLPVHTVESIVRALSLACDSTDQPCTASERDFFAFLGQAELGQSGQCGCGKGSPDGLCLYVFYIQSS